MTMTFLGIRLPRASDQHYAYASNQLFSIKFCSDAKNSRPNTLDKLAADSARLTITTLLLVFQKMEAETLKKRMFDQTVD